MLADRVALLEAGRVTAVGTHSELLRESEHYRFVISSLEDEERRDLESRPHPSGAPSPVDPDGEPEFEREGAAS